MPKAPPNRPPDHDETLGCEGAWCRNARVLLEDLSKCEPLRRDLPRFAVVNVMMHGSSQRVNFCKTLRPCAVKTLPDTLTEKEIQTVNPVSIVLVTAQRFPERCECPHGFIGRFEEILSMVP